MLFSNDEDCLHLTKFARRYLIISVKQTQDDINKKLDSGAMDKILDVLEFGSKELGHLLHHFKNIKIEDPKVFQRNAPKTEDFYTVVEKSRPMIHRVLDERLENNQWPFQFDGDWSTERKNYKINKETGSQYVSGSQYYTRLCFSGMVVAADLYEVLSGMTMGSGILDSSSGGLFSSSTVSCNKTGETTSGTNKIYYYNCMGSTKTINVGSMQFCPININK